jgi:hypothetical protein
MIDRKALLFGASVIALANGFSPIAALPALSPAAWAQEGESGENGESAPEGDDNGEAASGASEGGESGESGDGGTPGHVDAATLLSMTQGHLLASLEFYRHGDMTSAKGHAGHPSKEYTEELEHAVSELGESGLLEDIEAFHLAVEDERPLGEIEKAYGAAEAEISRLRAAAAPEPKSALASVAALLREAGKEYSEGVAEGKVVNHEEYADAMGFVMAAREALDDLSSQNQGEAGEIVSGVATDLKALDSLFPDIDAKTVAGEASALYGAASRVEIAAGKIH